MLSNNNWRFSIRGLFTVWVFFSPTSKCEDYHDNDNCVMMMAIAFGDDDDDD